MDVVLQTYPSLLILLLTGFAAISDIRKGHIPNWLTLPPLVLAPVLFGIFQGVDALYYSLLGLGMCMVVPYLLFIKNAIGGGDVKLFASIGAIVGMRTGMEIQLFSFLITAIVSLGYLAWEGKLIRTLFNSVWLLVSVLIPKINRNKVSKDIMTTVRMGGCIFLATLIITIEMYSDLWFY